MCKNAAMVGTHPILCTGITQSILRLQRYRKHPRAAKFPIEQNKKMLLIVERKTKLLTAQLSPIFVRATDRNDHLIKVQIARTALVP